MGKPFVYFSFLLPLALTLGACQKSDDDEMTKSDKNLSVEAYLYVDEPVDCIKLHNMSSENSLTPIPVGKATVEIFQNSQTFSFHSIDSLPGAFSQSDSSISINDDSPIYLNIVDGNKSYKLMASIPPKLQGLEMDVTEIKLNPSNPDEVVASMVWEPITGYNYCAFVRNVDHDYFPIPDLRGTHNQSVFHSLITDNRIQFKSRDFTHQGHYDIYVTAVDYAYANFYNNPANIAELTDLNSGLPTWGVFTVFNGSAIHVHVN